MSTKQYALRNKQIGTWWGPLGWTKDWTKATPHTLEQARRGERLIADAEATGMPRHNGYCLEWDDVPPEVSVDDGWVAS
jgi:hypothetical protein